MIDEASKKRILGGLEFAIANILPSAERTRDKITASSAVLIADTMDSLRKSLETESGRVIESNEDLGKKAGWLTTALIFVGIVEVLIAVFGG